MKSITLKNITHTYGKHTVLHDVTLSLNRMFSVCVCNIHTENIRFYMMSPYHCP